ncbi:hypothetical protein J5226_18115 [Lysobacter sp. K5869]|uniref:hypothetical protein n=1 Tax=Lysobacter sp. K5869 TaxID=2820808 RepID=UPI001C0606F1|nr:hypothetical protein [Lysobacter sp. K5869]QWP75513.1 hypothetical protein J5226_18115 [Lysobacter sp. K5869]
MSKRSLAALAAFVFSAATVAASAAPPLGPCQQCRAEYQWCMNNGGWDGTRDCESPFSDCLIWAGCPLE